MPPPHLEAVRWRQVGQCPHLRFAALLRVFAGHEKVRFREELVRGCPRRAFSQVLSLLAFAQFACFCSLLVPSVPVLTPEELSVLVLLYQLSK